MCGAHFCVRRSAHTLLCGAQCIMIVRTACLSFFKKIGSRFRRDLDHGRLGHESVTVVNIMIIRRPPCAESATPAVSGSPPAAGHLRLICTHFDCTDNNASGHWH
jgi:hypothetical protein